MELVSRAVSLKRVKGGFRRLVVTELGEEQLCSGCGEAWPTDNDFYPVTATSMGYECRACTSERRRSSRTQT